MTRKQYHNLLIALTREINSKGLRVEGHEQLRNSTSKSILKKKKPNTKFQNTEHRSGHTGSQHMLYGNDYRKRV